MSENKSSASYGGNAHLTCEVCHNTYDKAFKVELKGETHIFDSFECAIHALAPRCAYCECRIIGHGVEADEFMYCCVHCAKKAGQYGLKDRLKTTPERISA